VAFPVGLGLASVIGSVLNYILKPRGNPWLLYGGIAMVCIAMLLDGMAYKKRAQGQVVSPKGIVLAGLAGFLMGLFYPLIGKARRALAIWGRTRWGWFLAWGPRSAIFRLTAYSCAGRCRESRSR